MTDIIKTEPVPVYILCRRDPASGTLTLTDHGLTSTEVEAIGLEQPVTP